MKFNTFIGLYEDRPGRNYTQHIVTIVKQLHARMSSTDLFSKVQHAECSGYGHVLLAGDPDTILPSTKSMFVWLKLAKNHLQRLQSEAEGLAERIAGCMQQILWQLAAIAEQ